MSFVFEHHKPAFSSTRIIGSKWLTLFICCVMNVYINRAGIVFFGNFHILKLSMLFQVLHSDYSHIHQADRLICAAGIHFCTHSLVIFQRFFEEVSIRAVFNFDVLKFCKESCVTAVVRPVCIEYADFCFGWIAFFTDKIILQEFNVGVVHGKTHFISVVFQSLVIKRNKSRNDRNVAGIFKVHFKSFRLCLVCKA